MGNNKLKTLTLILRSLPPKMQKTIIQELPAQVVEKLAHLEMTIDDQLTDEDWKDFYESWPEFATMISTVKKESKTQEIQNLMSTERPKVKEYVAHRMGKSEERPNLSSSITRVLDQVLSQG